MLDDNVSRNETEVVEEGTWRSIFKTSRQCAMYYVLKFNRSARDPKKFAEEYRAWRDSKF